MQKYELTIYGDGTAILTDEDGATVWTSDDDDDFAAACPGASFVTYDDADEVLAYLEEIELLPPDCEVDIVEADDTGLHEIQSDDDDEDEPDTMQ